MVPTTELTADVADAAHRRAWVVGVALTVAHLFVFPFLADHMALAWFEMPILAILLLGARRGRLPWLLPIAYIFPVLNHLFDPATGWGFLPWAIPAVLFTLVWKFPLSLTRLLLLGAWIGALASSGIFAWVWQAAVTFFEMSYLKAWPVFLVVVVIGAVPTALFLPLCALLHRSLGWPAGFCGALVYTVLDYWSPPGLSLNLALALVHYPLLLQAVDLIGTPGATMLIAMAAGLTIGAWELRERGAKWDAVYSFFFAAAVIAFHVGYGHLSLLFYTPSFSRDVNIVALIQPMAPLKIRADQGDVRAETARVNIELSREAIGDEPPEVLLWPEGAGPFAAHTPAFNPEFMEAISAFQREHPVAIAVNCVEFTTDPETGARRYYNAVVVIDPVTGSGPSYRKNILMPFGEYLPYERQLPFLRRLFPEARTILAGEESAPLAAPGGAFAPLICYEILFPEYVRRMAAHEEAKYLVNFTNDRWYGLWQQPRQHLAFAILRTVENRKPMVRPTNSGISAIIQPTGEIMGGLRTDTGERTVLRGPLDVHSGGGSPYQRNGNPLHPFVLTPLLLGLLVYVCLPLKTTGSAGGGTIRATPEGGKPRRKRVRR
jgi:apolipoprotein N-acyltransferase